MDQTVRNQAAVGRRLVERVGSFQHPRIAWGHEKYKRHHQVRSVKRFASVAIAISRLDAPDKSKNVRLSSLEIYAAKFLFEAKDVPSTPALRMAVCSACLRVHGEGLPLSIVDRAWPAPFPAVLLQLRHASAVIRGHFRGRKLSHTSLPREVSTRALDGISHGKMVWRTLCRFGMHCLEDLAASELQLQTRSSVPSGPAQEYNVEVLWRVPCPHGSDQGDQWPWSESYEMSRGAT